MDVIAYNPQRGRLETKTVYFSEDTTTWFDGGDEPGCVRMITDLNEALLITCGGRDYPILIYDVSREAIKYSRKKAEKLLRETLR